MPDLLTHAGLAVVLRARAARTPLVWFVVGSCLPDLASRLPGLALAAASWVFGFPVSLSLLEATGVCHIPLPYLVLCAAVALLLPEAIRVRACVELAAGGLLHLALDTAQTHLSGGYRLLFPLSMVRFEFGWIETDDSLNALPWLAPVVALVVAWRLARRRATT